MNKIRKVVAVLLAAAVVLGVVFFSVSSVKNARGISSNILFLTQPVTSFSGKVEKIKGNAVVVSNQYTLPQTAPVVITVLPGHPPVMPTPQIKTITYTLLVTDKTTISRPPASVPYLFKIINPAGAVPQLTVKDIRVGQQITVNSANDLRTIPGDSFEATTINLPPIANSLRGTIVNLEGNILTMKAIAPSAAPPLPFAAPVTPQEKEYRISITPDTEISRFVPVAPNLNVPMSSTSALLNTNAPILPPQPTKELLSPADLKVDMQVTVYTAQDVNETSQVTALRIEPISQP